MFFESLSKCSARITNVFFLVIHPCTLKSVYHPTISEIIFVLWGDQEFSDGLASFEVHLFAMLAANVFVTLTQPFGVRHKYMNIIFVVLCWAVPGVIHTVSGSVWLTAFNFALFRA